MTAHATDKKGFKGVGKKNEPDKKSASKGKKENPFFAKGKGKKDEKKGKKENPFFAKVKGKTKKK